MGRRRQRRGRPPGRRGHFVALGDRSLIVDEDVPDDELAPLADAVETQLEPPYRRGDAAASASAVGATKITTATITDEIAGDTVELAIQDGEQTSSSTARCPGCSPASRPSPRACRPTSSAPTGSTGDLWEVQVVPPDRLPPDSCSDPERLP